MRYLTSALATVSEVHPLVRLIQEASRMDRDAMLSLAVYRMAERLLRLSAGTIGLERLHSANVMLSVWLWKLQPWPGLAQSVTDAAIAAVDKDAAQSGTPSEIMIRLIRDQ